MAMEPIDNIAKSFPSFNNSPFPISIFLKDLLQFNSFP